MAIRAGSVVGTGAAIAVSLGWVPDAVLIMNQNDAGTARPVMLWTGDNASPSALKILAAGHTVETANGIARYAGVSGGAAAGFTIGADADLNAVGERISYIAFRNTPGDM
jgi:hypothetical protein